MRRRVGPTASAVVALAVLALGALPGCADDGTELRDPPPSTAPDGASADQPDAGFEQRADGELVLRSPAIEDRIPAEHTCDGADVSPPLAWDGLSRGAVELAVTVTDPDAGSFVHWAVAGLSPQLGSIGAGALPEGAVEATNGFGSPGWAGPCPPEEHRYEFTLHVLAEPLGLTPGIDGAQAVSLIESATVGSASFTATYAPSG